MEYINQRPFTLTEVYEWCSNIFANGGFLTLRDPARDWCGFLDDLQVLLREESLVFNPVKNEMSPWVDVDVLQAMYESVVSKRVNPKPNAENKLQRKGSMNFRAFEESQRNSNPTEDESI